MVERGRRRGGRVTHRLLGRAEAPSPPPLDAHGGGRVDAARCQRRALPSSRSCSSSCSSSSSSFVILFFEHGLGARARGAAVGLEVRRTYGRCRAALAHRLAGDVEEGEPPSARCIKTCFTVPSRPSSAGRERGAGRKHAEPLRVQGEQRALAEVGRRPASAAVGGGDLAARRLQMIFVSTEAARVAEAHEALPSCRLRAAGLGLCGTTSSREGGWPLRGELDRGRFEQRAEVGGGEDLVGVRVEVGVEVGVGVRVGVRVGVGLGLGLGGGERHRGGRRRRRQQRRSRRARLRRQDPPG